MEIDVKDRSIGCLTLAMWFLLVFCTGMILICLGSCRSVKYVPYETIKHDSIYITNHQKDSVYIHDSIFQKEKGDTLILEKWHTKYVEKQVHDTTYIAKVDTIREVFTNEVEKPLTWWQQTKMHIGAIALYLLALLAVIWVAKRHLGKL